MARHRVASAAMGGSPLGSVAVDARSGLSRPASETRVRTPLGMRCIHQQRAPTWTQTQTHLVRCEILRSRCCPAERLQCSDSPERRIARPAQQGKRLPRGAAPLLGRRDGSAIRGNDGVEERRHARCIAAMGRSIAQIPVNHCCCARARDCAHRGAEQSRAEDPHSISIHARTVPLARRPHKSDMDKERTAQPSAHRHCLHCSLPLSVSAARTALAGESAQQDGSGRTCSFTSVQHSHNNTRYLDRHHAPSIIFLSSLLSVSDAVKRARNSSSSARRFSMMRAYMRTGTGSALDGLNWQQVEEGSFQLGRIGPTLDELVPRGRDALPFLALRLEAELAESPAVVGRDGRRKGRLGDARLFGSGCDDMPMATRASASLDCLPMDVPLV